MLHAELERIANHLDVAVRLADAAGLAVATARFALYKEQVLRLVSRTCGSRFGRGVVVPGGVSALPQLCKAEMRDEAGQLSQQIAADAAALMTTSSFLDRLRGTGPLSTRRAPASTGRSARSARRPGTPTTRGSPPLRRVPEAGRAALPRARRR